MSESELTLDGVEARVSPISFRDGESITVEIVGATALANRQVNVVLDAVDAIETSWAYSAVEQLDETGSCMHSAPRGLALGHEAAVYVAGLVEVGEAVAGRSYRLVGPRVSIANPSAAWLHRETAAAYRGVAGLMPVSGTSEVVSA